MKVLIIEDEPQAADRLESLIREINPGIELLGTLDSVNKSVQWLRENKEPDLILMDIQLADGLSFGIIEQVELHAPVIFTTAYNEYALKAFKVNSIDYILKPVDKGELAASFRKYETLVNAGISREKMMESIGYAMQML